MFPGVAGIYTTLQTNYNGAREAQTGGMGSISAAMAAFITADLNLCLQLTDNVYDIRKMFPQNIVKSMSYFNEASLYPAGHHFHQHFHGTLAFGASVTVPYDRVITPTTHIQVKSKTAGVNIKVCLLVLPTDTCTTPKQVDGIGAYTWLATAIGPGTYLVLTNLNPTLPGDWDVDIID